MSLRKFNNYDLYGYAPVLAWNPLAMRCTPVNEGCRNCWHLKMADRLEKNLSIPMGIRRAYEGKCTAQTSSFHDTLPSGRIIAVQFMGDLWHKDVWCVVRRTILSRAEECQGSIFLLLTKRPENVTDRIPDNCWIGVSAHDGPSTIEAVKALGKINAKHKWLSIEPFLEPFELIPKLPNGLDFLVFGPETIGGVEQWADYGFNRWFIDEIEKDGIAMYDKRKDWSMRKWPEEWKRVCKRVKGGAK